MSTATIQCEHTLHGFTIRPSFTSPNTSRVCSTQQGWNAFHPKVATGPELGWSPTLGRAYKQINQAYADAYEIDSAFAKPRNLREMNESYSERLSIYFPDASAPAAALAWFKAERERKEAEPVPPTEREIIEALVEAADQSWNFLTNLEASGREVPVGLTKKLRNAIVQVQKGT